jgi:polyisoprenoid-binding protein YceI
MKPTNRSLGFLALLSTVVLTASAAVAPISFQPESRLWVDGTSNVRSYSCKATAFQGNVAAAGADASLAIAQLQKAVRTVEVSVAVQSLECGNGTMNAHLRNALKMQANPTIEFELSQYDVIPGGATEGTVKLKGNLTIAGQEKPVTIDASVTSDTGGALRVRGSKEILMSEFGVRPPTLMMGTLKVRDRVVVNFDVVLKQS